MKEELAILWIALLGGIIELDVLAFGQWMFSRPIVASTIVGFVLNVPESGLLIGVILELLYISVVPFGVKVGSECTAAAVMSVVCSAMPLFGTVSVPVSVAFGVFFGFLFRVIDEGSKRLFIGYLSWVDSAEPEKVEHRVSVLIFRGLAIVFFKAVFFYLAFIPVMSAMAEQLCSWAKLADIRPAMYELGWLLPAVGVGFGLNHLVEK